MIKSVLVMRPTPGRVNDVVALFRRQEIVEKALTVDGCHDVQLLANDKEMIVTATWNDAAAYQRWLDHPERNASNDELNELLAEPITSESSGGLYEVVHGGSKGTAV